MSTRLDSIRATTAAPCKLRGEIATNPQPAWLAQAIHETVHAERGRAKVIADALGRSEQHVTDLADPLRRVALKAHEIPKLILATNCYAVLDVLEEQVGRTAFRLVALSAHQDEMTRALARDVRLFGEFLQENGDALADGRLEPHEVAQLTKSIDQMIAGLCEYRELVVEKGVVDVAVSA